MKNIFILSCLIISVMLAACNRQSTFDDRCEKEARQQTLQYCPQKIIDGLMLDSITYTRAKHRFSYYYTIDDSMYVMDNMPDVREKLRADLLKSIKSSVELKKAKENNVVFQYTYYGKYSQKSVLRFTFEPQEYKH